MPKRCGSSAPTRCSGWRGRRRRGFDLVFLDPPFDSPLLAPALAGAARIVAPGGFVYAEGPAPVDPAALAALGLEPWRSGRAGAVHFQLVRKAGAA